MQEKYQDYCWALYELEEKVLWWSLKDWCCSVKTSAIFFSLLSKIALLCQTAQRHTIYTLSPCHLSINTIQRDTLYNWSNPCTHIHQQTDILRQRSVYSKNIISSYYKCRYEEVVIVTAEAFCQGNNHRENHLLGKGAKSEGYNCGGEHSEASPDRLLANPGRVPHARLRQLPSHQGSQGVGKEDWLDDLQGDLVVEEKDNKDEVDGDADVSGARIAELELDPHLSWI